MIDLAKELAAALSSPTVRAAVADIVRDAIRNELGAATNAAQPELVDAEGAAKLLDMSVSALRKAAYRGTVPCERMGRRLRFRVAHLLDPKRWNR